MMVLLLLVLAGMALPLDPFGFDLARSWEGATLAHPCGRDGLGRDILARLLTGIGTSLGIAMASLGFALVVGVGVGGIAGWIDGPADTIIMRGVDLMMGIRELALAVVVAALIGPSLFAIVLILGLGWSPVLIRFVRSLVLMQSGQVYVQAAEALGAPSLYILRAHILPNIAGPLMVRCAAIVGPMIQTEAALSFLGIGVQDPGASLGTLIRDGLTGLRSGSDLIMITSVLVFIIALTFTMLADELRDRFDPRSLRDDRNGWFLCARPHLPSWAVARK